MERFITTANVILTYEDADEDGNSQEFYNAPINVGLPEGDDDLGRFEVDVIKDVLAPSGRDKSDLVKISLCYDATNPVGAGENDIARCDAALEHLCRHNAKYYFQPNQRDDYEQAIVDALDVASRTKDL